MRTSYTAAQCMISALRVSSTLSTTRFAIVYRGLEHLIGEVGNRDAYLENDRRGYTMAEELVELSTNFHHPLW